MEKENKKLAVLKITLGVIVIIFAIILCVLAVIIIKRIREVTTVSESDKEEEEVLTVPHEGSWGIYALDLGSEKVELIFSDLNEISYLSLNDSGNKFTLSKKVGGEKDENGEIFTIELEGTNVQRLTSNNYFDVYPVWSPDGSEIAFLSFRATMDIYKMHSDGSNMNKLYDSGFHDADISWVGERIAFTRNSQIWIMNDNGSGASQLTNPPKAGEWGNANLPFGDYDPRISPDGTKVIFERLVGDTSKHGNYDIFVINSDGIGETRLTNTGYSQGFAGWSHSQEKIAYLVAAIGESGKFDIYMMNADGSDNENITPEYFPNDFLCHSPQFSPDDSKIYFVGEWWEE